MGRPAGSGAAQWLARLEAFVAEHRRWPWTGRGDEGPLARWATDVQRGRRHAPPAVLARLDELAVSTPRARRPYVRLRTPPQAVERLAEANAQRRDEAAEWTVDAAARVLSQGRYHPANRVVLLLRIERPHASLAELAAHLGMSKDAYAARLRRAISPQRR